MKRINKKGFTLMEILSCVIIIGLLSIIISSLIRVFYMSNIVNINTKQHININEEDELIYNFLNETNKIKQEVQIINILENNDIEIKSSNTNMLIKYQGYMYINDIEYPFIYYDYDILSDQILITYSYNLNTYYLLICGFVYEH